MIDRRDETGAASPGNWSPCISGTPHYVAAKASALCENYIGFSASRSWLECGALVWRSHFISLLELIPSNLRCPNYSTLARNYNPSRERVRVLEVVLSLQKVESTHIDVGGCLIAELYWLGHPDSNVVRAYSPGDVKKILGFESDDHSSAASEDKCEMPGGIEHVFDVIHVRVDNEEAHWGLISVVWTHVAKGGGTLIIQTIEEEAGNLLMNTRKLFSAFLEHFVADLDDAHVILETKSSAFAQIQRIIPSPPRPNITDPSIASERVLHIVALSESETYDSRWSKYLDFLVTALPFNTIAKLTIERDMDFLPRLIHIATRVKRGANGAVLVLLSSVRSQQYIHLKAVARQLKTFDTASVGLFHLQSWR